MKSPIPKERLRVSNWIVQRLYNYAVNKTVVVARLVLHGAVLRFRVHRDRLATSYRLVLDFWPLFSGLRRSSICQHSHKIIHENGDLRVRRGESQCPHLGRSIAPVCGSLVLRDGIAHNACESISSPNTRH